MSRKCLELGERARPISGEGAAAHDRLHGAIGVAREPERPLRHGARGSDTPRPQELFDALDERVHRARAPECPFGRDPVVEPGCAPHAEALEELSAHQRGGRFVVLSRDERVEPIGVELHRTGAESHLVAVRLEPPLAEVAAQCAHRLVERVARVLLGLVSPQQPDQMLPGAGAFRRAREVDEEREVLPPQQRGRRPGAVHAHIHRAQRAADDHAASHRRAASR